MSIHELQKTKMKIIHFFNRKKIKNNKTELNINHLTIHLAIYHQMMMTTINQVFLHHIHRNIVHKNHDKI